MSEKINRIAKLLLAGEDMKDLPRRFSAIRNNDESGVSGTGNVLDGVVFPYTGQVVVCWKTDNSSLGFYDDFDTFMAIHVESHPGNNTEIVWHDEE